LKNKKVEELNRTIQLRKERGFEAALQVISQNAGKEVMDQIRSLSREMENEEMRLLAVRDAKAEENTQLTTWIIVGGGILSLLIILGATLIVNLAENERMRAMRSLESQNRIRSGLIQLNERLTGEQSLAKLAKNVIETLANFVQAQVGAIYLTDDTGTLTWAGGYGFQQEKTAAPLKFKLGDGLVGQAADQKTPISLSEPPNHYLKVRSGLGDAPLKSIEIVPFIHEGQVKGVAELGALSKFSETESEYLKLGLESIAVAFNSAQTRAKVVQLLEETQAQSEEL
jgi:transcriptional regulator with GAF, ATPase, and Fis domain